MNREKKDTLKRDDQHPTTGGGRPYTGGGRPYTGGDRPYTGTSNPNYTPPRSSTYWAIRVGLVILGFAIGIIVSNL